MAQGFPTDLVYDYAGSKEPHLLDAGYFLSKESVLDLFDESTADNGEGYPETLTNGGNDFFIRAAGTTFIEGSLNKTWFVELMSSAGSTIHLYGTQPNGHMGGLLVAQSVTALESSDLMF